MTNQNPKLKVILKSEVKVFHLSTSHRFLTSITDILSNAFSRFQLKWNFIACYKQKPVDDVQPSLLSAPGFPVCWSSLQSRETNKHP